MTQLDLLGAAAAAPVCSPIVDATPSEDGPTLWGVDYGQGKFHICPDHAAVGDGGPDARKYQQRTAEQFLSLGFCRSGDRVVVELAHLTPRAETRLVSKAQPFSYKQLCQLVDAATRKGVEIRLWPQGQTPRARGRFYGHIGEDARKSDAVDSHTIALAAADFGFERLQHFNPRPAGEWNEIEEWAFEQKRDMNEMCRCWMGTHNRYEVPGIARLFDPNSPVRMNMQRCAFDTLDQDVRTDCLKYFLSDECLGNKATSEANGTVALWSSIVNSDGGLRVMNGKPLGINNTMRYLLGNKPCHHKGGVARSNLWWHKFRSMLRAEGVIKSETDQKRVPVDPSDPKHQKFVECKRRFRKAIKATLQIMRECAVMSP